MSSLISVPGPQPGIPVGPVSSAGTEGDKPVTSTLLLLLYYINTATTSWTPALIVAFFLWWLQELPALLWVIRWTR